MALDTFVLVHNPTDADQTVGANTVTARATSKLQLDSATNELYTWVATKGCIVTDATKSYAAFKRRLDGGFQLAMRYYEQEALV